MGRHPYFQQHAIAIAVAAKFRESALWGDAQILAWVLMPDHFHGLVTLSDENISRMVQRVKACTARASGLNASIWMPGFHDHALRGTEGITGAVEYILMNPVRAGLCERWDMYPHLASVVPIE